MNPNYQNTSPKENGVLFLCRKELAFHCQVSLSTVDRGIRDDLWPFNAYIRISPRRILYPSALLQEIEQKAKVRLGGKL